MRAADCQTNLCVGNPRQSGVGVCTQECVSNDSCPGLDLCVDVGGTRVCAPSDVGKPTENKEGCITGWSVTPIGVQGVAWSMPQQVCTTECQNDFKCPAGYRCGPTQLPNNGGEVNLCTANVEGLIPCTAPAQHAACAQGCATGQGLCAAFTQDGSGPGFCSCGCRSAADCLRGYGCDKTDPQGGLGVCMPIAGYACPPPFPPGGGIPACMSTRCLTPDEGELWNYCSTTCQGAADCPEDYRCEQPPGAPVSVCTKVQ